MGRRTRKTGSAPVSSWLVPGADWSRSGIWLLTMVLVVLSIWLLANFVGQIIHSAQMDRQRDALQQEITKLEGENRQLATEVAFAQSPAYAEQAAREQLGYAREGDIIVQPIMPKPTVAGVAAAPQVVAAPAPQPNWQGWLHAFFPPGNS